MDSDPWADAPSTPKSPSQPSSPAKNASSPKASSSKSPSSGTLTASIPPPSATPASDDDGFDDFDDFGETAAPIAGPSGANANSDFSSAGAGAGVEDDEGFGDFGDFEEGDFDEPQQTEGISGGNFVDEPFEQAERWHALSLRPFPPKGELLDQLSTLLSPLFQPSDEYLTKDQPRIGSGLSQVLVAEASRDIYAQLITAPMLKQLDWTRSRVRREHLISMGVPVNLDEVDSHRLSALPPLRITTNVNLAPRRADSLDVNGRNSTSSYKGKSRDVSPNTAQTVPNSANGGQKRGIGRFGLGEKPDLNVEKAEEYCGLEEDRLSLLPLATLRKIQAEVAQTSALASSRLAWELQLKDAQTQDSTTYNGMISELISNAAKVKSAQVSSGGVFRKSSVKRPQSVSGTVTPRRTGSPGMW
ncbi:uncharacterized protein I303_100132 [Kwoniella dejecticola CBS 10117]|uniref:Uncharacterized protein n=1 Tax=Kwoniella dejecticola CBS 10117 TaxID=1296121 RepID=A0A1A6AE20_9TREE|nr:uncharacterized protein I303_00132 [Kwoniella dejecticola CBS 10117]OBR88321.1 hypothetical protein I303_00132 [Kwoniella dejecticola CBS 10117]